MPHMSAHPHPRRSMAPAHQPANANAHRHTTMRHDAASQTVQRLRKFKFMNSLDIKLFVNNDLRDPLPRLTSIQSIL
jgi:hypothetical protein